MPEPRTWEELELPVLRWVHEATWAQTGELRYTGTDPAAVLPELTEAQLHDALRRLQEHGLITGLLMETTLAEWQNLRPTADGLRVLGEWPPVEAAAVNTTLAMLLRRLSRALDSEDATAAKRAGSSLARMPGELVHEVVTETLQSFGEGLVS